MAKILYRVSAKGDTYKDSQGNDKVRWVDCGVVFESKNGMAVKLEALPVKFDGWLQLFEPKDKEQGQQQPQQAAAKSIPDDDVPF